MFRCPRPQEWNRVYEELKRAHRLAGGAGGIVPPTPLILAWNHSSASEKHRRWAETVEWATAHGLGHVVASIPPEAFDSWNDDPSGWLSTLDDDPEQG